MAIFMGCSVYFWIGVLLFLAGGISAIALQRRRLSGVGQGERSGDAAAARWPFTVAVLVAVIGLAVAGNTMWQGNCAVAAGPCPPSIATGSGYPCAASGAACKVAGLFNGVCKNESSVLWTCECQCR